MNVTNALAILFVAHAVPAAELKPVACEGHFKKHLQGVCWNNRDVIYWCFTDKLVATDLRGRASKTIDVPSHHGDLCFADGKLFVAVNLGKFSDPKGNADSWVYEYDADLSLKKKHAVPDVFHGAGGIAYHDGRFLVVGGLPDGDKENLVYEYNPDFKFVKRHALTGGTTEKGIQTAAFADGHWWFGCYGKPTILLKSDASLTKVERYEFDCALGILPLENGRFLIARGENVKDKGFNGKLVLAEVDKMKGLTLIDVKPAK